MDAGQAESLDEVQEYITRYQQYCKCEFVCSTTDRNFGKIGESTKINIV